MSRRVVDYPELEQLATALLQQIDPEHNPYDVLLFTARGGMNLALTLSHVLPHGMVLGCHLRSYHGEDTESDRMPEVLYFPPPELLKGKRVIGLDEVWQRGHTNVTVRNRVHAAGAALYHDAVYHFKSKKNKYPGQRPTFFAEETDDWIDYRWEIFGKLCRQYFHLPEP